MQFFLCFSFFDSALVADIEAGPAQDAFALIDLIGHTNIDAAFGAEKGTSSTRHTPVRNEIKLFLFFVAHTKPPAEMTAIFL